MLRVWWWALHALLMTASLLPGWPWPMKLATLLGVLAHLWLRRLPDYPPRLVVGSDGSCQIPQWGPAIVTLAPRTRLTPFVVDLHFGTGLHRRVLLLADQVEREEWARLCAILRRIRLDT
jgi:hypothetical protein